MGPEGVSSLCRYKNGASLARLEDSHYIYYQIEDVEKHMKSLPLNLRVEKMRGEEG